MEQLSIFDAFDYLVVDDFLINAPDSIVAYYFCDRRNAVTSYATYEDDQYKLFKLENGEWMQDERWLQIIPNWKPGYYWTWI